jgi:hypothetical protein
MNDKNDITTCKPFRLCFCISFYLTRKRKVDSWRAAEKIAKKINMFWDVSMWRDTKAPNSDEKIWELNSRQLCCVFFLYVMFELILWWCGDQSFFLVFTGFSDEIFLVFKMRTITYMARRDEKKKKKNVVKKTCIMNIIKRFCSTHPSILNNEDEMMKRDERRR